MRRDGVVVRVAEIDVEVLEVVEQPLAEAQSLTGLGGLPLEARRFTSSRHSMVFKLFGVPASSRYARTWADLSERRRFGGETPWPTISVR